MYLIIAFVLFSELFEVVDDDAGVGAVVDVERGRAHPRLQVVHRQRDVLRVRLTHTHTHTDSRQSIDHLLNTYMIVSTSALYLICKLLLC